MSCFPKSINMSCLLMQINYYVFSHLSAPISCTANPTIRFMMTRDIERMKSPRIIFVNQELFSSSRIADVRSISPSSITNTFITLSPSVLKKIVTTNCNMHTNAYITQKQQNLEARYERQEQRKGSVVSKQGPAQQ